MFIGKKKKFLGKKENRLKYKLKIEDKSADLFCNWVLLGLSKVSTFRLLIAGFESEDHQRADKDF